MPSFISFRGRRYYEPSVVVDVNNNLITPDAGEKSLCVVGDFPVLPKGVTHTFGPTQQFEVTDVYPLETKLLNYNKIFYNSIDGQNSSASRLTFVNAGDNTPGIQTLDELNGTGEWGLESKYYGVKGNNVKVRLESIATPFNDPLNDTLSINDKFYRVIIINDGFDTIRREAGYANQLRVTYTDDNAQEGRFCKIEILPLSSVQSIRISKFDDDSDNALIQAVIDKEAEIVAKEAEITAKTAEIVALDANDDGTADNPANQGALDILIGERTTLQGELTTLQDELSNAEAARDAAIEVTTRSLEDFADMDALASFITGMDDRLLAEVLNFDVEPKHLDNATLDFPDVANAGVSEVLHAHNYALYEVLQSLDIPFTVTRDAAEGWFSIEGAADAGDGANPIFKRFTGGTQTSATATNYRDVLALLEDKDFTTMCVLSTSRTIHRLVQTYNERSLDLLKERNYILPVPANQTIAAIYSTYVLPLNNARFSIVGQKIDYTGYNGLPVQGDTLDMAFMMMCMQGALSVAEPMTRKSPAITNVYQSWNRERDNDNVIKSGILAVGKDLKIARGITTWMKDNRTSECEISARESVDTCVREIRKAVDETLGSQILTTSVGTLKKLVEDNLTLFAAAGFIKSWQNVQVSIVDDTSYISFDIAIVAPHNFSSITINLV